MISFNIPTGGFRKGIVWPKCQTLCTGSSLSRRQVQDCRANLESAGLITVERTCLRSATPHIIIHWGVVVAPSIASKQSDLPSQALHPQGQGLHPQGQGLARTGAGIYKDQIVENHRDSENLNAGASRDQHDADTRSSSGNGNAPTEPTAAEILDRLHRQLRWLGLPATLTRLNRSRYVAFLDSVIEQESARVVSAVFYSLQDFRSTWPVQAGLAACLSDRGFEALWQLTGAGADILDAQ